MDSRSIERYYPLALWYQQLRETTNEAFFPLFADEHRYLVLMGGGGSGKSIFAGRKVLERVTSESGHRYLVVRKVAKTLRESCFRQLVSQAYQYYRGALAEEHPINRSDMRMRFSNGSEIIFAGLDDVEKLKSIYGVTGIWIEEASELLESDFNQLDIRLRGESPYYKQIILSFNPVSITHWLKRRFFDINDLRARTHRSTYLDNRFLPAEDIATLLSFKDSDPYYYTVYALGEWGTLNRSVFDTQQIAQQLAKNIQPYKRGYFTYQLTGNLETGLSISDIRWVDDLNGPIRIYSEPEEGHPYVIGGDTAGGGSDQFCGQVLDNLTAQQVAVLHHQFDEDLYTMQMYCLGEYYHQALIGIEANFSSYPNKLLAALSYGHLYVREVEDSYSGRTEQAFGVVTSSTTRPVMIAGLVAAAREDISTIVDRSTLEEMLTFVRNEHFRAEAEAGAHDDTVMALAIAHDIRPQGRLTLQEQQQGAASHWTEDMWEDYQHASEQERELIIAHWGPPC